jgi:hypothetical protein
MKKIYQMLLTSAAVCGFTLAGSADVIVNQTNWPNGDVDIIQTNQNLPYSLGWQLSKKANYWATNPVGVMTVSNVLGSITLWAYLADSNGPPISLDVGQQLRVTANLIFTNVIDQADLLANAPTARGLRWGFLLSSTNQLPLTNGTGSSLRNMPGYSQDMNFATAFTMDGPLTTWFWTNVNLGDAAMTHEYNAIQIGDNGGGHSNDPAFTDGLPYTFIFNVAHTDTNVVNLTTVILGSTLTNGAIMQTVTDTNFAFTNFDTFALRPSSSSVSCGFEVFTGFKVETLPILPTAPHLTSIKKQSGNYVVTWNSTPGYTYSVLRTNNLNAHVATWPPAIVTGYPPGYATGSSLSYTDTTATAIANYYLISSP